MSFLFLEEEKINVTAEGLLLTSVKDLYDHDKKTGKPFFHACCRYAYFMYKKNGVFASMLPQQRGERVCSEMLKDAYTMEDFELHTACKAMMNQFVNLQYTMNEILYEGIKDDIQGLLQRLKEIPYVKKQYQEVSAEFPDTDGILTKQRVKAYIEIDNSEEKAKAIKLAETLIDYESKLKAKIMAETKEARKKQSKKRLFETE